jgi:hypothetical protein
LFIYFISFPYVCFRQVRDQFAGGLILFPGAERHVVPVRKGYLDSEKQPLSAKPFRGFNDNGPSEKLSAGLTPELQEKWCA